MAGNEKQESEETQGDDCTFVWDDESQMYFHASSGFYHDPNAGWYFSSRDGLYYKFDNGTYVLLDSGKEGDYNEQQLRARISDEPVQGEPVYCEAVQDDTERVNSDGPENPLPPSEWLEESLIDLYLTGYPNSAINGVDDAQVMPAGTDVECDSKLVIHGAEGLEEGTSLDEDNWRAQYGQVIPSEGDSAPAFPIIDLWDWALVTDTVEKKRRGRIKTHQVARLVGKLLKPSAKLHPSMSSAGLFKTAAICEVHLALVRVSSGKVYRLKSPSLKYLASVPTYDSSDPTRDWGFPDLATDKHHTHLPTYSQSCVHETPGVLVSEDSSPPLDQLPVLKKNKGCVYRDRAAERRALQGGFGVGPGQKDSWVDVGMLSSPTLDSRGKTAPEALSTGFHTGCFARKMLESMGWKEGEPLGKTRKGLLQPLEAVGNNGYAGLGWYNCRPNNN